MTIHKLAAAGTKRMVYGIDYSETSVASSRRTNQLGIKAGHVQILHGSVSLLPFPDQMFDVATAVETHFYWPDLPADLREVLRILKPGGALVLIAEVYKGGKFERQVKRFSDAMQQVGFSYANLSVDDHHDLLSKAGFADIQILEEYDKGWICSIGKKPLPSAETEEISNS